MLVYPRRYREKAQFAGQVTPFVFPPIPGFIRDDSREIRKKAGTRFILRQEGNIYHKIRTSLTKGEIDEIQRVGYIGIGRGQEKM